MSYTTLYAINRNGEPVEFASYKNSHGSAAAIWDILTATYVHGGKPLDFNLDRHRIGEPMPKHWAFDSPAVFAAIGERYQTDMPDRDAVVYFTSLDEAAVKVDDLPFLVEHMRVFANFWSGQMQGRVFHLAAQADDIQRIYDEREANGWIGVCWDQTSLSETRWGPTFAEDDEHHEGEGMSYDFRTGDRHVWFDRESFRDV